MPEVIALPTITEPAFTPRGPARKATDADLLLVTGESDVLSVLRNRFPQLESSRSSIHPVQIQSIASDSVDWQRLWLQYEDGATANMHGACSQGVFVWLAQDHGPLRVFVDEITCPI